MPRSQRGSHASHRRCPRALDRAVADHIRSALLRGRLQQRPAAELTRDADDEPHRRCRVAGSIPVERSQPLGGKRAQRTRYQQQARADLTTIEVVQPAVVTRTDIPSGTARMPYQRLSLELLKLVSLTGSRTVGSDLKHRNRRSDAFIRESFKKLEVVRSRDHGDLGGCRVGGCVR